MFTYCCDNPVNFMDPTGAAWIGVGVQFELDIGSYTCGVEVIVYWDKIVCGGNGPIVSVYTYEGASFSVSNELLKSPDLLGVIEQLALAIGANMGTDYEALTLVELQAVLFDSGVSCSVVGIWGHESFRSPSDYTGQFTSYSGSIYHVKGAVAYSDTCVTVAVGATTEKNWALSFGQTNYVEIYRGTLFPATMKVTTRGGANSHAKGINYLFCSFASM